MPSGIVITEPSLLINGQFPNEDEVSDSESEYQNSVDAEDHDLFDAPMIRCVNCNNIITAADDIIDTINAVRHPNIAIAFAVPLFDSLIIRNTLMESLSNILWQNVLRCRRCEIFLTIQYLTVYNTMIDEYFNDIPCVILDASSVVIA